MAVVLDTSFLIDFERGHPGTDALLDDITAEGETLLVPSLVVAEYLAGARDPQEGLAWLQQAAELTDFTIADAAVAADLAREAYQAGAFPGWVDAMIAGFARSRGDLRIVTRNAKDFPKSRVLTY